MSPGEDSWRTAFVAFLDVYGFSAMIAKEASSARDVLDRLLAATKEAAKRFRAAHPTGHHYSFSDSTFLVFPCDGDLDSSGHALRACCEAVASTMALYIDHKLPLRGGIAYGPVIAGDQFLIGEPVERAVRYEKLVPGPLVLFPLAEARDHNLPGAREVHLRNGGVMKAKLIYPMPLETFQKFAIKQASYHSIHGPYEVAAQWVEARRFLEANAPRTTS